MFLPEKLCKHLGTPPENRAAWCCSIGPEDIAGWWHPRPQAPLFGKKQGRQKPACGMRPESKHWHKETIAFCPLWSMCNVWPWAMGSHFFSAILSLREFRSSCLITKCLCGFSFMSLSQHEETLLTAMSCYVMLCLCSHNFSHSFASHVRNQKTNPLEVSV